MKQLLAAVLLFMWMLTHPFTGYSQVSADQLRSVKKIVLSGPVQLEVKIADSCSFDYKAPEQGMNCLFTEVSQGVLTIRLGDAAGCPEKAPAVLRIPFLPELDLSGKAEIMSDNLILSDSVRMNLRNGSKAYIDMDTRYLEAKLTEGSLLVSKGYAVKLKLEINTKATFSAFELESRQADIKAGTLAIAKVCVSDELTAVSSSNAYIGYKCEPARTELKPSLGGKIEKVTE